ncbi:helix-turn-helix domain-containing protein [Enterococcus sp. LJL90]
MYGITIRRIRKDKGLSLKEIYTGVCSKTNAIKFEKGERELNASRFNLVLSNLMLSMDEFLWLLQSKETSTVDYYPIIAGRYWNENRLMDFEQLLQDMNQQLGMKKIQLVSYQMLLSYSKGEPIAKEQQEIVLHYFSRLSFWTFEDLKFFTNNCFVLPYETFLVLLNECLKASERYNYFPNSNLFFASLLSNSIERMLAERDFSTADNYIRVMREHCREAVLSGFMLINKFYQAQVLFGQKNVEAGNNLLDEVVQIASFLDNTYLLQEIQKFKEFNNSQPESK